MDYQPVPDKVIAALQGAINQARVVLAAADGAFHQLVANIELAAIG